MKISIGFDHETGSRPKISLQVYNIHWQRELDLLSELLSHIAAAIKVVDPVVPKLRDVKAVEETDEVSSQS